MPETKLKPCPKFGSEHQIFFKTSKGRFFISCNCGFCSNCYNTLDNPEMLKGEENERLC